MTDMASWVEDLKKKLSLKGKKIHFGQHPDTRQLFINFYNLPDGPDGVFSGSDHENNRLMFTVLFPGPGSWYEKPVAEGTLRVKLSVWSMGNPYKANMAYKFRGKTCTPERMIDYLATYINRIAEEIPSRI